MRKLWFIVLGLIIASSSWATEYSKVELRAQVTDETNNLQDTGLFSNYFTTGVRQSQVISATASTFTALTIPTGAKAILIDPTNLSSVKLKGVTGDTGISLDSQVPVLIPISDDNTTIGFQNMDSSAKSIRVYYL